MKAKLPIKTALSNIKEEKNEDLSFSSNEHQVEINENDISGFIGDIDISAIINNDKNKKEVFYRNYSFRIQHQLSNNFHILKKLIF